MHVREASASNN